MTAKLSRQFYHRLGEQVANELVEWFNQVDASYRADLKEINDLNHARFSAEVGQRFAEWGASFEKRFADLEKRFAEQDAKMEKRFADFEKRFAEQDAKMEKRFAEQEVKFERRFAEFEVRIERAFREQTRFLYLALATQVALIAGLYLR